MLEDPRRRAIVYALTTLMVFVFLHSFIPADPRVRMGFKTFEVEWGLSAAEVFYALKKWRHLLWFALFFPLVRFLFTERPTLKAIGCLFGVTILIEFQQAFIAGRHARLADLLPNLIGSTLGVGVYRLYRRGWRKFWSFDDLNS